jgi:16S rRNA (cytosine967-C5)-methyltransferase
MFMANARKTAVKVLVKIEKEGTYSNLGVAEALKNSELNPQDKSLATAIIYGVLDRKITLDYILSKFLKTSINKTEPFTLMVLRSALYQIKYMDKIPESAAVNEAVKIMKSSKFSRNAGFVNGVLRSVLRTDVEIPKGDSAEDLSVRYSCPLWIVESFLMDYGLADTKALLEESLKPAPTVLRINTVRADISEIEKEYEIKENSIELTKGIDISNSELYKKGLVYAQDFASQKAVMVLNPKAGDRVLDLCSAPGGKAFTMANLMGNKGEILACDLYPHRVELIERTVKRLGLDIIKTAVADATRYNPKLGEFDCVLCDVPCSGLGVIRRKPEIKYNALPCLEELKNIQLSILKNAVKYLKKGGKLLYSTCTLRREENEKLVISFQKEYNDLCKVYEHTFMPHKDGTDGFYCALFEKR